MFKANGFDKHAAVFLICFGLAGLCSEVQAVPTRLLIESDADAAGSSELFAVTYDSYADFLSDTPASGVFSSINIASGFTSAGFAFDGSQYHLLIESDDDDASGSELFAVTYDSYADFLSDTPANGAFSSINIASDFTSAGFAFDGSRYHLLIESDTDAPAGSELFAVTYDSYADFLSDTPANGAFSSINIASGFTSAGFATERQAMPAIPEPAPMALISVGLMALFLSRRQARRHRCAGTPVIGEMRCVVKAA